MNGSKLPGGPTQDEVMAVALSKLGIRSTDTVLDIGCGTGKVSLAAAGRAQKIFSIDRRQEAIRVAKDAAKKARITNIEFFHAEAVDFLDSDKKYDCAFVGGSKQLTDVLTLLAKKVRRNIVMNAVLVNTLSEAVVTMQRLGIFCEVVHVQIARSHDIAGSIMFKPIDPVYVIVGSGAVC